MKIQKLSLHPYELPLTHGQMRSGLLVSITDAKGNSSWGEIAPLPKWSQETLNDALHQLQQGQDEILRIDWTPHNCFKELAKLELLPSVSFGLESALLSLLVPLSEYTITTSALLMGSSEEILKQATLRYHEGFTSAKLKVGHLTFKEAAHLIDQLKDKFRLRVDVNRAWSTSDSLHFFAEYPLDTFDYVEEPFQDPHDLPRFLHPLAVDESFPQDLSLEQLESLPKLKALIYKPTIQGGMLSCLPLHEWAIKKGVSLVLSSSFESDLGLAHVASMAHRMSLSAPVGIGTYHHLNEYLCETPLRFSQSTVYIPARLTPLEASLSGNFINR